MYHPPQALPQKVLLARHASVLNLTGKNHTVTGCIQRRVVFRAALFTEPSAEPRSTPLAIEWHWQQSGWTPPAASPQGQLLNRQALERSALH